MKNMDDKPAGSINPIKSSNEILSELFGAFNAEPPSIDVASGLDQQSNKTHHKKSKRHKSTKKHKTGDETEAHDRSGLKKKHKLKKHKHKRKSKKHKRKSMSDSEGKRKDKTKKKGCKKRADGRSSCEREDSDTDKSSDDSGVETLELNVIKSLDKINVKKTEPDISVEMTDITADDSRMHNKESDSHTLIEKVAASSVIKEISTSSSNATESLDCEKKDDGKGGVADAFEAAGGKLEKSVPEKRKLNFASKITIKNLKNSTVFEETVRQVEEQARLKAEKYEEGEISDESSDNGQSKSGSGTPLPSPVVVVDSLTKPSAGVSIKCSKQQHVVERGCHRHQQHHKAINTTGGSPALSGSGCKHRSESKERRRSLKKNSSSRSPPRSRHKKRSSRSRSKENRESDRRKKDHHRHHHHRHPVVSSGRKRRSSGSPVGRERDYHRKRGLRSRSRSRSRSPYSHSHFKDSGIGGSSRREECQGERDREKIDKRRLLEIARKNALNMLKQTSGASGGVIGTCTSGAGGTVEQTKATIAAGGKTVDELTDFCKLLSKKDAEGHESISSNTSNNNSSESESEKPFHHPFQLKDRPQSIVMNIRNSVSVPVKTLQEKTAEQSKALRLQFPVSSGQLHRKKESDWVPVSPKRDDDQPSTAVQHYGFTHTTNTGNSSNSNGATAVVQPVPMASVSYSQPMLVQSPVGSPLLPVQQQPPRSPIQVVPMAGIYQRPPMPPEQVFAGGGGGGGFGQAVQFLEESSLVQAASTGTGTGGPSCSVDITMAVNHRLSAMKRLQQNPHDVEALAEMNKAQQQAQAWVESKSEPGHFTGSTGARVLSAAELASGAQAWARKDQLNVAAPVQSGMGMAMLQKMGWKPGEGLGKNKEGTLEPLKLQVKMDKKGLVASDEVGYNQPQSKNIAKNFYEGKHPVSLLNELCSRKRYGPPIFDCCYETGPDHKKMFIFKVTVNGVEYKPSIASQNKKQAKVEAATLCLKALGLIY